MRLLLDTHAFLLWVQDSPKLSPTAREVLSDGENEVLFSVVSAWEITAKVHAGKLRLPDEPDTLIPQLLLECDMEVLPLHLEHVLRLRALPEHHRDPFDRLLVAQAAAEEVPLLSDNSRLSAYPVRVLW